MIKPASLRAALIQANPHLKAAADSLHTFIDKGTVSATAVPGGGFAYGYTCSIVVTDYHGHPDSLFVPLIAWLAEHQPDLLLNQATPQIEFEAEILTHDTCDVEIRVQLTERVVLRQSDTGGLMAEHLAAPGYDATPAGYTWQLFLKGQEIMWPPTGPLDIPPTGAQA